MIGTVTRLFVSAITVLLTANPCAAQQRGRGPTNAPPSTASAWRASTTKDELTDKPRAVVRTDAEAAVRIGVRSDRPTLIIRCNAGSLDAYISTDNVLDDNNLEIRFDERTPKSVGVTRSDDYKAVFFADEQSIVEDLLASRRLRVRLQPYSEVPVVVAFRVAGLKAHLPRLEKAGCQMEIYNTTTPVPRADVYKRVVLPMSGVADPDSTRWPWVTAYESTVYYRSTCAEAQKIPAHNRVYSRYESLFATRGLKAGPDECTEAQVDEHLARVERINKKKP